MRWLLREQFHRCTLDPRLNLPRLSGRGKVHAPGRLVQGKFFLSFIVGQIRTFRGNVPAEQVSSYRRPLTQCDFLRWNRKGVQEFGASNPKCVAFRHKDPGNRSA